MYNFDISQPLLDEGLALSLHLLTALFRLERLLQLGCTDAQVSELVQARNDGHAQGSKPALEAQLLDFLYLGHLVKVDGIDLHDGIPVSNTNKMPTLSFLTYQNSSLGAVVKEHANLLQHCSDLEHLILDRQALDARLGKLKLLEQSEELARIANVLLQIAPALDGLFGSAVAQQIKCVKPRKVLYETAELFAADGGGKKSVYGVDRHVSSKWVGGWVKREKREEGEKSLLGITITHPSTITQQFTRFSKNSRSGSEI